MNARAIVLVLALFSLLSTATGGYLHYHSAKESAVKEAEVDLVAKSQLLNDRIVNLIAANQLEARALALFEELQEALLHPNRETLSQANRVLDHFSKGLEVEVCYLVDNAGNTVASSNRQEPESFVGKNYGFRPYFREAIQGTASSYMALGVTSELRGIYFSYPVYVAGGNKPIGVAVIKASVKTLERDISQADGGIALLVHSSGMIFVSSRKDWVLNLLWTASPEELSQIAQTQQFGKGPWKWTGLERRADNQAVDRSGELYKTVEMNLENCPGWRTVHLQSVAVMSRKLVDPLIGWTGYAALILFVFVAGMVVYLYRTAHRDFYRRKQAEDALRKSEANYRAIFDSMNDAIFLHDFRTGAILDVNPKMCEMYGYTRQEAIRLTVEEVSSGEHPYTQEEAARWIKRAVEYGPQLFEWTARDKAGGLFWVEVNLKVAVMAGEKRVLAVVRGIEERKKVQEALQESEERFRTAFQTSPDAVNINRLSDGLYVDVNIGFTELTGFTREEVIGKSSLEVSIWNNPEDRGRLVAGLKERGYVRNLEAQFRLKDGRVRIGLISARTIVLDGEPHILSVTRDVDDWKKAEDAIRSIVEGVSGEIGEKFIESSVMHFGKILEADFTLIGEILHSDHGAVVRTIAFSSGGELQDNFEYDLGGSPCEEVTVNHMRSYPQGVAQLFPQDEILRSKNIEAYVGVGLYNSRGIPIGIMAAMYLQPLDNVEFAESVLRIFASRAAAEIERNRAEEALRDSEATLRTLIQAAPIGIGQVSADRTLGWTNQLLGTMLGYSREELAGQSARILYESEEEFLRVGREKHPDVIRHGTGSLETRFKRKDGTAFDVLLSSSSVLPGDLSHGMVFTAMDITERKASEQQLKRLGAAVESAGETIVVTDSAGSIIYVNPAFEETTGYSRQEALGQNPRILKSGKHDRAFYREVWDTLLAGQVWRGRFTNKKKDGTLYEETATISPIKDKSGRTVNYVAVKRDVTGETMLQKQLLQAHKMEAIGTLAGGLAHDFNNLLQAILGYSDLLLMKKGPGDPDRKKLEVIQHAARDGADLVSRILTFSRKAESRARPIDLNEEIRKAQELLRRTVPRMIEIKLVLAENLQIVDADPAQVEQVLLNLAVNAQHAMPDGGQLLIETSNVWLSDEYLGTHLGAKAGTYVLLTVSDTGAGMAPDVQDRIFEPFFTTKADGEGTGLGLSMVHGIVSQHGGYVRCYSEPGIGTSFKIYFPVSFTELVLEMAETRVMPASGDETILLVDDDDRVREMAQEMIQERGYKVLMARSGEEALEIYAAHRDDISLVILDLIMPGMGGKKCLEELLRIDPNVKVLVASGYSSNGLSQDDHGKGCRGFVTKPYDAKDILAAIRKVLDQGQL